MYLCALKDAQMAESVDALVSNTNRFTPVPVRPRLWVRKGDVKASPFLLCITQIMPTFVLIKPKNQ